MSEIEKYYNGEIIVDFEEETELEKKYNEVAELYSKAVKKKIEYRKEIERLNKELQDTKEHLGEYLYEQEEENKRLNNIINESAEEILKELEENHHLSYGVALAIRQKLIDYRELKGDESNE